MRKYFLSLAAVSLFYTYSQACAWSDPDYEYFNLFTQSIIKDKSYLPFLHSYSTRFYADFKPSEIPDENIDAWKRFFNNQFSYAETDYLVNKMSINDLNALKKGNTTNPLLIKAGPGFYRKYSEAVDYLIEAKYLEPYMRIKYVANPNAFFYSGPQNTLNATSLDYQKTISALTSLYNTARNPEIKQRYGYQLVRFNHYTRNYDAAVHAFKTYVQPIQLKGAPYIMALDQLAGAQRGLGQDSEANWNFFQVFKDSRSRKESAFVSMKLSDTAAFNNMLKRAQTDEDKNMAYFLLGYDEFTNPIPVMEKMYAINPDSEILKVMAVRSINELERSYLPIYYYDNSNTITQTDSADNPAKASTSTTSVTEKKELSFWQKVVRFFKNLFSSPKKGDSDTATEEDDEKLLNNPNRIPLFTKNNYYYDEQKKDFLEDLEKFTDKVKEKTADEYWQIADAYLKFLKKDYKASTEILQSIKTSNPEYKEQIQRMKLLNDIVSQPRIDADYEDHLMKNYAAYFKDQPDQKKDSTSNADYYIPSPSTKDFLKDVLANRYFLQGEDAKSFLISNKLSDLQYGPDLNLVKNVEAFYRKPQKTEFEQQIIAENLDDVGNIDAFFALIYGDHAMKLGDFANAKSYYVKAQNFSGIPRKDWSDQANTIVPMKYATGAYNGFSNIPDLVFGHNVWVSYTSSPAESMEKEDYSAFPFIKPSMNKLELADALLRLKQAGNSKGAKAAKANQLIGNLLYNTSILGYYRQLFVMDLDNTNGGKYDFQNQKRKITYQYYYKNFPSLSYLEPDNFDLSIGYYNKALSLSTDREQKTRILFQMASAEQGKYYQYEANSNVNIDYSDPKWSEKQDAHQNQLDDIKNQRYRTYFTVLRNQYADTQTAQKLMGSCSYLDYFMK
ncbi:MULTISPECIES: hypothetical protein [Chryseobacterium]|uniref:Gliding motility protein n=1 Tax=Chryseobacterium camelliae TaxID=1265445 RepID=A0ABU0TNH8_9FLAO|nr:MULTISPECIES: hypothetical protein [Chryseobacterium]MDT3407543.1 hypothetical protein [Pseudacidovorax intermedius]MDQ1098604.1 hypothetical protein [Chryseobacterium camelliae]MDQ1102528.1 hypothetical protein [Chryseobacterium sp. SORGH_AS_1048]MDR6085962.1 hypothetical protein [Chryseobacterium sp. SORGH_AS_0909]MDR6130328.1 hypothetical protein [Chryseobacterium sp. SORGH_AS_1175]